MPVYFLQTHNKSSIVKKNSSNKTKKQKNNPHISANNINLGNVKHQPVIIKSSSSKNEFFDALNTFDIPSTAIGRDDFVYFAKIFEDCLKVPDMPYTPTSDMLNIYLKDISQEQRDKWEPFLINNHYILYLFQILNILAKYDNYADSGVLKLNELKGPNGIWSLKELIEPTPNPTTNEVIARIYDFIANKHITLQKSYNLNIDKVLCIDTHGANIPSYFKVPDNIILCFQTPINKYGVASSYIKADLSLLISYLILHHYDAFLKNPKNFLNNFACTSNFTYYYPGQIVPDLELSSDVAWDAVTKYTKDSDPIITKYIDKIKLSEYVRKSNNQNSFILLSACRRCSLNIIPPFTELFYRSEYFYTIFNNTFMYKLHELVPSKLINQLTVCNKYLSTELSYSKNNRNHMPIKKIKNFKLFYDPGLSININDLAIIQQLSIYYFHKPNIKTIESIVNSILNYYFNKFYVLFSDKNNIITRDKFHIGTVILLCVSNISGKFSNILQYYMHNTMFDELELVSKFILTYKYKPENIKLYRLIYDIVHIKKNNKPEHHIVNSYEKEYIQIKVKIDLDLFTNAIATVNTNKNNINIDNFLKKYPQTAKLIEVSEKFDSSQV